MRAWSTPDGDGLGLYFFPIPPDLPRGPLSLEELREFYGDQLGGGGKIVEVGLPRLVSTTCVWVLLKVPQRPSGMTYVGSLTVPFAKFSFVIKLQCEERGPTGMREAVLLNQGMANGTVDFGDDGQIVGDWSPDDPKHDARFVDHPVSRLRREFALIQSTLELHPSIENEPRFSL